MVCSIKQFVVNVIVETVLNLTSLETFEERSALACTRSNGDVSQGTGTAGLRFDQACYGVVDGVRMATFI